MASRSERKRWDRRQVLAAIASGATLSIPGWTLANNKLWVPDDLPLTPQQTEGPFYPEKTIEQQVFNDTDLSQKIAGHEFAKGQRVVVTGIVKDQKGKPLPRSIVEVWQACASGRYSHSRDSRNARLLDNNFQFWGRSVAGEDGRYAFTTIIPGKYPGRTARHIHFRVDAAGYKRCSTQCYFSDFGEDNMQDGLYRRLSSNDQKLVTVEFDKLTGPGKATGDSKESKIADSANAEKGDKPKKPWVGQFDVVLAKN